MLGSAIDRKLSLGVMRFSTKAPALWAAGLVAMVWLVNGLWCKVLAGVPRHEAIVARILGAHVAPWLTVLIGISEVVMAAWVLSRWRPRWCGALQIALVLTMNLLEFGLARDLLLWGPANMFFALLFALFLAWVYGWIPRRQPPSSTGH